MNIINSIKLLLFPKAFARAEIKESKRKVEEEKASFGDMDEWYEETLRRIKKKRIGKAISLFIVSVVCLVGYASAQLINTNFFVSIDHLRLVRLVAVIIVGWAVLGRIGYETPTIDGNTLLEQTSENTFKLFYLLGLFITTIALFLEPDSINIQIQPTPEGTG